MKTIAILSSNSEYLISFRGTLIKLLTNKGYVVYALSPDFNENHSAIIKTFGAIPVNIKMARARMNPVLEILDFIYLIKQLKGLKPDVFFSYTVKPVIYGSIAAYIVKIPHRVAMIEGLGYVFSNHPNKPGRSKEILKSVVLLLYKLALKYAHKVVFLNMDDISDFKRWNIVSDNKIFCLGGIGVDLIQWAYSKPVLNPIRFILVARLLKEKGIFEYIAAIKSIKNKYSNVEFVLLGDVDKNPGSIKKEIIKSWVTEGLITWPGHVDVKPWLQKSSVFVLPSYREGVPRSTQEAMAIGRPIITTDVPGCRNTVQQGYNGYLIPPFNSNALADTMEKFITNPELIEKMGIASRKLSELNFDIHKKDKILYEIIHR